jgi:hypothetical protein
MYCLIVLLLLLHQLMGKTDPVFICYVEINTVDLQ